MKMAFFIPVAVCILLGDLALLLDLGSRLFGAQRRTPTGVVWRVFVLFSGVTLLTAPAYLAAWYPRAAEWRYVFVGAGAAGALLFANYAFPYRWGFRRVETPGSAEEAELLTQGLFLESDVVRSPSLPEELDGLSLLVITDLHCNDHRKLRLIRDSLDGLIGEGYHAVLILGDFGEERRLLAPLVASLGRLTSRWGTFCVRGNHDFERGRGALLGELLPEHGIRILSNESLHPPGAGLTLMGFEAPWERSPLPGRPPEGFVIGLTHTPDNIGLLQQHGVDFAVAGHTHGGRRRLPGFGHVLAPCRYGRFLDRGLFRRGDTLMYIVPGVGRWTGLRGEEGSIVQLSLRGRHGGGGGGEPC